MDTPESQVDAVAPAPRGTREGRTRAAYARVFFFAFVVVLIVRGLCVQGFRVTSASMLPSLFPGDYILVSKIAYGIPIPGMGGWLRMYRQPRAGDVIVFATPPGWVGHAGRSEDLVKRVVAVAGETVEIRAGIVFINGRRRDTPCAYHSNAWRPVGGIRKDFGPVHVGRGRLFVLGDNRNASRDSRIWGLVDVRDVVGKAVLTYWSWDELGSRPRWRRVLAGSRDCRVFLGPAAETAWRRG